MAQAAWAVRALQPAGLVEGFAPSGARLLAAARPGTLAALRLVFPARSPDPCERTALRVATHALTAHLTARSDAADWECTETNDRFTLGADCLDEDLPEAVGVLRGVLDDPSWLTDAAAERAAAGLRARAARDAQAPAVAVRRAFLAPYRASLPLNCPASPGEFDLPGDAGGWRPRAVERLAPTTACVVAARTADEAFEVVAPLLGAVRGPRAPEGGCAAAPDTRSPGSAAPMGSPAPHRADDGPAIIRDRVPHAADSTLRLAAVVPGRGHEDYPALQLASLLLGGYHGSLLAAELRERLGIAYSPRALLDPSAGAALFCIEADVTAGTEDEALRALERCLRRITGDEDGGRRRARDEAGEIARVLPVLVRLYLGRLVMSCSTRAGLASVLAGVAADRLPADWPAACARRVSGLDAGRVRTAFARHCAWSLLRGRVTTG